MKTYLFLTLLFKVAFIPYIGSIIQKYEDGPITYCGNVTIYERNVASDWALLQNCNIIEGNLRIHQCRIPFNASLFKLIQVTGYIVLEQVSGLETLADLFPRLSVIRGQQLLKDNFAIALIANIELREIGRWSLSSISRGAVFAVQNALFCTDYFKQWNAVTVEYRKRSILVGNQDFCPFIGCEEDGSCEARPRTCLKTGLPCSENDLKCSSLCLGGCYEPKRPDRCVACRGYLKEGSCVSSCASPHISFLGYRCFTVDQCMAMNGSISRSSSKVTTIAGNIAEVAESTVKGSEEPNPPFFRCLLNCSEKFITYKSHPEFPLEGPIKTCEPRPICESSNLDNDNLGDHLKGCRRIEGNLIIRVSGGNNVAKRLERNLGAIEVISGYLMVASANALYSLSFLKNLTLVEGNQRVYGDDFPNGYVLYVVENQNLREFWDLESRALSLEIRGPIMASFNDRLCPRQVEGLRAAVGLSPPNVTEKFNGKKTQCQIFHSALSATPGVSAGTVVIWWMHTYCGVDNRYVFGYEVFYRQAPLNVSKYSQRDVCSEQSLWSREVLKMPVSRNDTVCMTYQVEGLLTNTRYAFYVRSLAADKILNTIESDIAYAVTRKTYPKTPPVGEIQVSESGLRLSLSRNFGSKTKPSDRMSKKSKSQSRFVSGNQIYEIQVTVERSFDLEQMQMQNQCQIRTNEGDAREGRETVSAKSVPVRSVSLRRTQDSCPCREDPDDIFLMQKERKDSIEIEKEISRLIYRRSVDSMLNGSRPSLDSVKLISYREQACRRKSSNPGDCPQPPLDWTRTDLNFSPQNHYHSWAQFDEGLLSWSGSSNTTDVLVPLWDNFRSEQALRISAKVRSCVEVLDPCPPLNSSRPCALCSDFTSWTKYHFSFEELNDFQVATNWRGGHAESDYASEQQECKVQPFPETSNSFTNQRWSSLAQELLQYSLQDSVSLILAKFLSSDGPFLPNTNDTLISPTEDGFDNPNSIKINPVEPLNLKDVMMEFITDAVANINSTKAEVEDLISFIYSNISSFQESVAASDFEQLLDGPYLKISWNLPPSLETVAVGYQILYWPKSRSQDEVGQICVSRNVADALSNTLFIPSPSSYSVQVGVRVATPAGLGPINQKCVIIPWNYGSSLMVYAGLSVGALLLVVAAIAFRTLYRKTKKIGGETQNKYYGVTWLEYIQTRFHLSPGQLSVKTENTLGGGEFGVVYEGTLTTNNGCKTTVAVKTIRDGQHDSEVSREEKIQALLKEAVIMQNIDSWFVVGLVGVAEQAVGFQDFGESSLYVALEYMSGGDLKTYLQSRRERGSLLSQQEISEIAIQVADGMGYLSAMNLQHRDLAARNCLIEFARSNGSPVVKIADFGLTRYLKQDYYYFPKQNKPLPVRWMAPEALHFASSDRRYSFWSDVWSFGVLLYEVASTGRTPYEMYTNEEVWDGVSQGTLILETPNKKNSFLADLIRVCLNRLPRARPKFPILVEKLFAETCGSFQVWFSERSFYHNPKPVESVGDELDDLWPPGDHFHDCEDEGFFPGSSLEGSQETCEKYESCATSLEPQRDRQNEDSHNLGFKNSLTSPAAKSCWALSCASRRDGETRRRFSFSSDALL